MNVLCELCKASGTVIDLSEDMDIFGDEITCPLCLGKLTLPKWEQEKHLKIYEEKYCAE